MQAERIKQAQDKMKKQMEKMNASQRLNEMKQMIEHKQAVMRKGQEEDRDIHLKNLEKQEQNFRQRDEDMERQQREIYERDETIFNHFIKPQFLTQSKLEQDKTLRANRLQQRMAQVELERQIKDDRDKRERKQRLFKDMLSTNNESLQLKSA